jgi:DNA-directed RNA polymerase specialized sigma24 family protein
MGDLTKESFDRLLDWLDADRDSAALKYEKIRLRMVKILASRGCCEAETLTDEIIDRVAAKMDWLIPNYVGDPMLYFYGVAQNVHKEYLRKKPRTDLAATEVEPPSYEERERQLECLDSCIKQLPEDNARLAIRYYQGEKQAKIYNRKQLAAELGITLDALRIRAHRIRLELKKCVLFCLEEAPAH